MIPAASLVVGLSGCQVSLEEQDQAQLGQSESHERAERALQEVVEKARQLWPERTQIPRPKASILPPYPDYIAKIVQQYYDRAKPFVKRRNEQPSDNTCSAVAWSWPDLTSEQSVAIWERPGDHGILTPLYKWIKKTEASPSIEEEKFAPFNNPDTMRSYFRAVHYEMPCQDPFDAGQHVRAALAKQFDEYCPLGYCGYEISSANCLCESNKRLQEIKDEIAWPTMMPLYSERDETIQKLLDRYVTVARDVVEKRGTDPGTCSAAHIQIPDLLSEKSYRIRKRRINNDPENTGQKEVVEHAEVLASNAENFIRTGFESRRCEGQYDDGKGMQRSLREQTLCTKDFCIHEFPPPICDCGPSNPNDIEINKQLIEITQQFVTTLPESVIHNKDWATLDTWSSNYAFEVIEKAGPYMRPERGACKMIYSVFPYTGNGQLLQTDDELDWMSTPDNVFDAYQSQFLRSPCQGPEDFGKALVDEADQHLAELALDNSSVRTAIIPIPVCNCMELDAGN